MEPTLVLIHSPLLGPSSWFKVRDTARAAGMQVAVPDLTGFIDHPRPRWNRFVDLAVAAASEAEQVVAVGHSGAGTLLPIIAMQLGNRLNAAVFVDAVIPNKPDRHEVGPEFASLLDTKTTAGTLEPWIEWWPSSVIEDLLPAAADRELLAIDTPNLPRDTYDDPVDLPKGWARLPAAYLQLSPAYFDDNARAVEHGWPSRTMDSTHLAPITQPVEVLEATLDLAAKAHEHSS